LINVVENKTKLYTEEQTKQAAGLLQKLVVKSGEEMKAPEGMDAYDVMPIINALKEMQKPLYAILIPLVPTLVNILQETDSTGSQTKYSSFSVERNFSIFRLNLVEVIHMLMHHDSLNVLNKLGTSEFWPLATTWFFTHAHNNVYHVLYYKMFRIVLENEHEESLRSILRKSRLINKLIDAFKARKNSATSGLAGFCILISNVLRLKSNCITSGAYVRGFLRVHLKWQNYLKDLSEVTKIQAKSTTSKYEDLYDVAPFFAPTQEKVAYTTDDGIDLGSSFATILGFDEDAPEDSPSKKVKPQFGAHLGNVSRTDSFGKPLKQLPS